MRFRRRPDGGRVGWGCPDAGAPSVGHPGAPRRQGRNGAVAGGSACSAFFELPQRAGRIAPRGRRGFAATTPLTTHAVPPPGYGGDHGRRAVAASRPCQAPARVVRRSERAAGHAAAPRFRRGRGARGGGGVVGGADRLARRGGEDPVRGVDRGRRRRGEAAARRFRRAAWPEVVAAIPAKAPGAGGAGAAAGRPPRRTRSRRSKRPG